MTIILDNSSVRIDEPRIGKSRIDGRHVDKPRATKTYVTPAVLILLAAATLTFLNLAAAVYTFRSTSSLSAIEDRLGELKAFEDRIAGQLNRMNDGVQARLEMLQNDFRGEIGGLRNEASGLAIPTRVASQEGVTGQDMAPATEIEPVSEPTAEVVPEPVVQEPPPPKRTARANDVEPPPAYERIQTQDGKVYYRKAR